MVKNRISHTAPCAIALFWFHVDEFLTPASHCTIPYLGAVFTTSHQIILFFFSFILSLNVMFMDGLIYFCLSQTYFTYIRRN